MLYTTYIITYIYLKGLWEGLSELQLREHGLIATKTQPLQPFVKDQPPETIETQRTPFGSMTFSQIEERFHR